jgi:hypothetical protein
VRRQPSVSVIENDARCKHGQILLLIEAGNFLQELKLQMYTFKFAVFRRGIN